MAVIAASEECGVRRRQQSQGWGCFIVLLACDHGQIVASPCPELQHKWKQSTIIMVQAFSSIDSRFVSDRDNNKGVAQNSRYEIIHDLWETWFDFWGFFEGCSVGTR